MSILKGLNKDEIFKRLKENRKELLRFHVKKIGLFGSFLRGNNDDNSDIDFLVIFEEGKKNYNDFIELAFFLEDLFHRKVDLLTEESLSPYMKTNILPEVYFESI